MGKVYIDYKLSITEKEMLNSIINHIDDKFENNDVGARKTIRLLQGIRLDEKLDGIQLSWAEHIIENGFIYEYMDEDILIGILKSIIKMNGINYNSSSSVIHKKTVYPEINF